MSFVKISSTRVGAIVIEVEPDLTAVYFQPWNLGLVVLIFKPDYEFIHSRIIFLPKVYLSIGMVYSGILTIGKNDPCRSLQ